MRLINRVLLRAVNRSKELDNIDRIHLISASGKLTLQLRLDFLRDQKPIQLILYS